MERGDRREAIFQDDSDRERFLRTLGEVCGRTGWLVHAWVLKLAIAALVPQRTSVSNGWLAEALALGHLSRVSQVTRKAEAVKLARKIESTLSK